jgi:predicted RNA binding protein YcfA (HicA-like mRNA interferase family)
MKAREIVAILEADGWRRAAAKGGHAQFRHPGSRAA